nr:nucleolar and coiled-body phosphoprotein 1-like [Aegilops tauschii subsp. strangulata]
MGSASSSARSAHRNRSGAAERGTTGADEAGARGDGEEGAGASTGTGQGTATAEAASGDGGGGSPELTVAGAHSISPHFSRRQTGGQAAEQEEQHELCQRHGCHAARGGRLVCALNEMYSMPNGEQEQDPEGEASGGESGEWHSDGEEDEESDDPSDEEEVDSPPHMERRSKHTHDPASIRGKATAQTGQSSKRPRTSSPAPTEKAPKQSKAAPSKPQKALPKIKVTIPTVSGAATSETSAYRNEDEEMEDAVTSNPAPPTVIDLLDDDEDVPLRPQGEETGRQNLNQALVKKDEDLAVTQKIADEKTALAEQKIASVEFCQNFEEETGRVETSLDPIHSPVKDEAAMNEFQNMISNILAVDRSPEDAPSDAERRYSEERDNDDDKEESNEDESSEDGEVAQSSPSYEAPKEPRTKAQHEPSGKAGGAPQTTRSSKRARAEAECSAEKQPKLPKKISAKPRKVAVPRIKVAVPATSA